MDSLGGSIQLCSICCRLDTCWAYTDVKVCHSTQARDGGKRKFLPILFKLDGHAIKLLALHCVSARNRYICRSGLLAKESLMSPMIFLKVDHCVHHCMPFRADDIAQASRPDHFAQYHHISLSSTCVLVLHVNKHISASCFAGQTRICWELRRPRGQSQQKIRQSHLRI